jgi:hypothetical protein
MSEEIAPVLEGARTILESWPESKSLKASIAHVEKAMGEKSDSAIDAAKCLIEALCKTILSERGVKPEPNPKLHALLKQTCTLLGLSEAEGGEYVRNMVSGMTTAIQALGDFRNHFGPLGHGRDAYHAGAEDWQRTIAVRTAEAICVLIHESYRRLPALDEYSRRPYRQELQVHESMDRLAEVTVDEETHEIVINGVTVRPSEILWDYDRIAYIEQKRAAEDAVAGPPSFDDLREVEPLEWQGRTIVEQDNMGDWGGWLGQFDGPLQDAFGDPDDDCTSLADMMAEDYIEECQRGGYPLPADFSDEDREVAQEDDRRAVIAEFVGYLRAWKEAWMETRRRKQGAAPR